MYKIDRNRKNIHFIGTLKIYVKKMGRKCKKDEKLNTFTICEGNGSSFCVFCE